MNLVNIYIGDKHVVNRASGGSHNAEVLLAAPRPSHRSGLTYAPGLCLMSNHWLDMEKIQSVKEAWAAFHLSAPNSLLLKGSRRGEQGCFSQIVKTILYCTGNVLYA